MPLCEHYLEEATPPVSTFLKERLNQLEDGAPVPLAGPVLMISTLSGARASTLAALVK